MGYGGYEDDSFLYRIYKMDGMGAAGYLPN